MSLLCGANSLQDSYYYSTLSSPTGEAAYSGKSGRLGPFPGAEQMKLTLALLFIALSAQIVRGHFGQENLKVLLKNPADCNQQVRQRRKHWWMSDAKQKDHYAIADAVRTNISLDYNYETDPVDTAQNEDNVLLFRLGLKFKKLQTQQILILGLALEPRLFGEAVEAFSQPSGPKSYQPPDF